METQKPRKVTSGPIREKARTMRRMVAAVGKVLKKKGYPGLTIANIAIEAQVDRKLVYSYYGSLDKLVGIYLREQDYWKTKAKKQISILLKKDSISKQEMDDLLIGQFDAVLQDKILQRILQWELSEPNKALRMIADEREDVGEELLKKYEADISNNDVDIRAIIALQTAGLYYLALHAKSNGSTFCGIDINKEEGEERIKKALSNVLDLCKKPT
ncbi:TetR/AcrR family transcriptional regulator [Sphingobacterium lactis]|uniref:TetR/AcrR family transcriptional regulator n=1 Tax=Sphingobacterium lactis TaxID=797291 RepID=UPI003F7F9BC2